MGVFGLKRAQRNEKMPLTAHLDELRRRIIVSILALVVAFAALYSFHGWLIEVLAAPLPQRYEDDLITLSPTEPFFTTLKVVFWASIIVTLPVWLYQAYAFVVPAVGDQSRRRSLLVVGGVALLFAGGVAFGYFVVLPVALDFLLGFGEGDFNTQVRAGEHFSFVTTLLLASGLLFEVPIAMLAFARLGVVTAAMYRQHWRIALVAIAALAAILPGGDPLSMLLLMVPQILLYILGIWLASLFGGAPLWDRDTWTNPDEPEVTGEA
jgi:sec-independent protein translocase protein TatC